jgi:hypothetical protein
MVLVKPMAASWPHANSQAGRHATVLYVLVLGVYRRPGKGQDATRNELPEDVHAASARARSLSPIPVPRPMC